MQMSSSKAGIGARARPPERTDDGPRYRAPALEKGLDILELLASQPDGLSQGAIAKALGRSPSEIFRMLNCLRERCYIALHKPGDIYALTLKLFELSHRHPPIRRLVSEALPLMNEIARKADQSCHLAVSHDGRILVVAQVDSPGGLAFSVRMGAQLDLLRTASGLVMLAFRDDEERRRMLDGYTRTNESRYEATALQTRLAVIRKRGYEEADSEQVPGVRNLSFPVRDFSGQAVAAIAIPYLRRIDGGNAITVAAARELLEAAAGKLSCALGFLRRER